MSPPMRTAGEPSSRNVLTSAALGHGPAPSARSSSGYSIEKPIGLCTIRKLAGANGARTEATGGRAQRERHRAGDGERERRRARGAESR